MEKIKNYFDKISRIIGDKAKGVNKDKDVFVFTVFLLVASFFWMLNALRKDYVTELHYPVKYVGFPKDKIVSGKPIDNIVLKVNGGGFTLLRYIVLDDFNPLVLKVSEMSFVNGSNRNGGFELTRNFKEAIVNKLSSDVELINMYPDTLFMPLEERVSKKVAVKLEVEASFEKQYLLADEIKITPDSIHISGARNIVDTISFVKTNFTKYEALNDTLIRNIAFDKIEGVYFSKSRGVLFIPVEPYTESKMNLPINVQNLPDSFRIKTFPAKVNVSYWVGLSKYEAIQEEDFSFVIDYNEININGLNAEKLKIRLMKFPNTVSNVSYSPLFSEFLLEKKY